MTELPILGFDGRDDACTDAAPLIARWKDGRIVGGILAPLDPQWLKAHREDLARNEELRERGVVVLNDHRHKET